MTFLIESLIACAIFTLFVFIMSRNPIKSIFNYPPAIIERCDQLGLVDASNRPRRRGILCQEDCRHDDLRCVVGLAGQVRQRLRDLLVRCVDSLCPLGGGELV